MKTFNITEAKKHFSSLVQQAHEGEPFIIAKAGKPLVKVIKFDSTEINHQKRLGFMKGQFSTPEDFDEMGRTEINKIFL